MKRNKPPVKPAPPAPPAPPVIKGMFSVSPNWADVLLGDLALAWWHIVGK